MVWRAGCIIRASLLGDIREAYYDACRRVDREGTFHTDWSAPTLN
jgi:6-phosphogluconate dehydrogenase